MKTLFWAFTNRCQMRCKYCYYETGLMPRLDIEVKASTSFRVLEDLSHYFKRIAFTGGEFLLHSNITKVIEYAKSCGLEVAIITNGLLMNEKIIQNVLVPYVDIVNISFDSIDSDVQNYLRPLKDRSGYSHLILSNIKKLSKYRLKFDRINILQTVTRKNISSIMPMIPFCIENDFTHYLHPVQINESDTHLQHLSLYSCSEVETQLLETAFKKWAGDDKLNLKYTQWILDIISGNKLSSLSCPMGTENFFLNIDGEIYPCFYRFDIAMGNIFKDPVHTIFNFKSANYLKTQPELQNAHCHNLGCLCLLTKR